jgi:hypothetical protein
MEPSSKSFATATPEKMPEEGLGWAVRLSWPGERSETVVGFRSEDEANEWIRDGSATWISRTEALREDIRAHAVKRDSGAAKNDPAG